MINIHRNMLPKCESNKSYLVYFQLYIERVIWCYNKWMQLLGEIGEALKEKVWI